MGVGGGEVPYWVAILEAAGGDPLRAQEIENNLSKFWWKRYALWARLKGQAAKQRQKKNEGGKRGRY